MVISFTINRTTVELNTGGTLWIETATRQVYVSRGTTGATPTQAGEWVRKGFGWHILSSPRS